MRAREREKEAQDKKAGDGGMSFGKRLSNLSPVKQMSEINPIKEPEGEKFEQFGENVFTVL